MANVLRDKASRQLLTLRRPELACGHASALEVGVGSIEQITELLRRHARRQRGVFVA